MPTHNLSHSNRPPGQWRGASAQGFRGQPLAPNALQASKQEAERTSPSCVLVPLALLVPLACFPNGDPANIPQHLGHKPKQ